jgi:hypothetical protein
MNNRYNSSSNGSRSGVGRRPAVNIDGARSGTDEYYNNNSRSGKRYCPREQSLMIFRADIDSFFCTICAYQEDPNNNNNNNNIPKPAAIPEQQQQQTPKKQTGGGYRINTTDDNYVSREGGQTTLPNTANDAAMALRPIADSGHGTSRSRLTMKDKKREAQNSNDADMQRLKSKGYAIVDEIEWSDTTGTYNPVTDGIF